MTSERQTASNRGTRRATRAVGAVLALVLVFNVAPAWADEPVPTPATSAPSAPHLKLDPITEGQPAPYTGVLLDPATFTLYLREHVALEEANLRISARDKLLQQEAAKAERSWWERNGFWVGAAVGFIGSVFVVWEVRQVLAK